LRKKPTSSVRFWFYKPETKKTEPNPNKKNKKKLSQIEKKKLSQNWAKRVWTGFYSKNWTETGRFEPVSVLFFLISVWLLFLIKTEPKMITSTTRYIWFWDLLSLNIKTSFHKFLCQINEISWIFLKKN